ncbi:Spo0B domain-containing protein [Enterococcus sp. LJL120]
MKKGIRLWTLLATIFIATLLCTLTLFYLLTLLQQNREVQQNEENLLLATGRMLAKEPQVIEALQADTSSAELQELTLRISQSYELDFAVIMDMQGIRLTHPDETQIGQPFIGGDESPALAGNEHLSTSEGSLGESLRGFVPVFAEDGQQIGVVALGITLTNLSTLVENSQQNYTTALVASVAVGLLISFIVAYYLKNQLHNLEPKEISRLLEERNAMLNETENVVLVIDMQKNILLANNQAQQMYQLQKKTETALVGQPLSIIIYHLDKLNFQQKTKQFYQQEGEDFFFSVAPIIVGRQVGYIVFLENTTETLFLADQLSNTSRYALALQSQSHEFMNKLHVIYGLADLGAHQELNDYLTDIIQPERELTHRLALLVQNPIFAAFLLGERQAFSEKNCQLWIEVTPEIPSNSHTFETDTILNIYRYLHHFFSEQQMPDELLLQLTYQQQTLTSEYALVANETFVKALENALHAPFFVRLLKDSHGEIQWDYQQQWLQLKITTLYRGEMDDQHFNFRR